MQVLAAHCALKQSSDILASPGTMLASALTTDREQQEQHILTPASAKAAPAQCHAHHCSICGAARHTQAHTHACVHTYKYKRAQLLTGAHTHVHMHTHKYTRAHTYKRPNTQAHTRAHTHAHVHMHAHVARVMGFANFSASLALLPHLSTFLSNTAGDPRVSTAAGPIHDTLRQSSPTPTGVCHQLSR